MHHQPGLKSEHSRSSRGGLLALAIGIATLASSLAQPHKAFAQAEPEPNSAAAPAADPNGAPEPQTLANPAGPVAAPDERPMPPPPPRGATTGGGSGYDPNAAYNSSSPRPVYQPAPYNNFRPFSFSVGLGPGALYHRSADETSSAAGATYSLRFGFGVQPRTSITLGWEGSSAQREGRTASQDALILGVQHFVSQVIYLRLGMGIVTETDNFEGVALSQEGFAFQGGAGVDLLQASNISLALEGGLLIGTYPDYGETWTSAGVNLVFSLY